MAQTEDTDYTSTVQNQANATTRLTDKSMGTMADVEAATQANRDADNRNPLSEIDTLNATITTMQGQIADLQAAVTALQGG